MGQLLLLVAFAVSAPAQARTYLECKFATRYSSEYEEINGFTFEDYPMLTVHDWEDGFIVTVGGITYGDEASGTRPSEIKRRLIRNWPVGFENTNENEKWIIRHNWHTKFAVFYADLGKDSEKPTRIAAFRCE